MSSLEPEFEQLLSSYLDGAVTDAERAVVENRVAADPVAAAELAELRSLSRSVRETDVFGDVQLPQQFADQVIEAAIERARLEGHPDDHPLLRSATQPLGPAAPGTLANGRRWWAVSGVGLAVAASLLVAVTMLQPESDDASGISGLAIADTASVDVAIANDPIASVVAADESADASVVSETDIVGRASPNLESVAVSAADTGSPTGPEAMPLDAPAPTESVAVVPESSEATVPNLKMAMVLNVRLTDSALSMSVIRDAMRRARVDPKARQAVTNEIVASIGKATGDALPSGSLLYLRAPAKQIDRFIATLADDEGRVEGIDYGWTNEPILLDAVSDYVRVNPTDVQHDFKGVLTSQQASAVRDRFDDVVFIPADNRGDSKVAVSAQDSGPDVISHVLVLVGK